MQVDCLVTGWVGFISLISQKKHIILPYSQLSQHPLNTEAWYPLNHTLFEWIVESLRSGTTLGYRVWYLVCVCVCVCMCVCVHVCVCVVCVCVCVCHLTLVYYYTLLPCMSLTFKSYWPVSMTTNYVW